MSAVFIALCIALAIGILVGKDQAEYKLSRMHTRVRALGAQRQRMIESQREIRVLLNALELDLEKLSSDRSILDREIFAMVEQVKQLHLDVTGNEVEGL